MRGSSIRPRNPIAPPLPGQPGSGSAFSYRLIVTPLGISTASPPRCLTSVERAASDTAIQPLIFSVAVRIIGSAACNARDRGFAPCTVATIGMSATQQASSDRLGAAGSCTCSRSKLPSLTQRRTRLAVSGPNESRTTDPLYGTATARPDRDDVVGQVTLLVGGRGHRDFVTELHQRFGEVPDVFLHAAGHIPGVRADQADSHGEPASLASTAALPLPPLPLAVAFGGALARRALVRAAASRSGSRSETKTR